MKVHPSSHPHPFELFDQTLNFGEENFLFQIIRLKMHVTSILIDSVYKMDR